MNHTQLIDAIIQKRKAKKPRRIGDALFKTIVEMAYEMKYANRHCEAERTNRFTGLVPRWNVKHEKWNGEPQNRELPFDVKDKHYDDIRIGDIVCVPHFPRKGKSYNKLTDDLWVITRIAKVVRLNKKSISLKDCDQDGQLVEYNPKDDMSYQTKEHLRDYNKLTNQFGNDFPVLCGTKHLRYDGWNS